MEKPFDYIPVWEPDLTEDATNENWRYRETLQAASELYNHWRETNALVVDFARSIPEFKDDWISTAAVICSNACVIAPKIYSAAPPAPYQVQMQNAALIRHEAQRMINDVHIAMATETADPDYYHIVMAEMNVFRELFARWVATFKPDGLADEWGLFGAPSTGDI